MLLICEFNTQCQARVKNTHFISPMCIKFTPFPHINSPKAIPFGAAHTSDSPYSGVIPTPPPPPGPRTHKSTARGGEWYPENSGSRKILFQSRNLGGVFNESRNLVFLCFFASRILEFLAARSRSFGFCFLANGFDQNHEKIVYLIKNVR